MGSRSSSELRSSWRTTGVTGAAAGENVIENVSPYRARVRAAGLFMVLLVATACSTVRPEEKEFLAQPSMTFGSGGEDAAQEEHVISNREGSYGGGGVSGGGCGCN